MKTTLRMQKAKLQSFILNFIILIFFLWIILFYIIPKQSSFSLVQNNLITTQDTYNKISQDWISFTQFSSLSKEQQNKNIYLKTVIQAGAAPFYNEVIANKSWSTFAGHINVLEKELEEYKGSSSYIEREKSLESILPVYSKWDTEGLTELDFINYIERILYTFNLLGRWNIWIGGILEFSADAGWFSPSETNTQSLDEKIYYIPLDFSITGQKKDIFDFIHYFENVGNINYADDSIIPYRDNELLFKIIGSSASNNIYEGQITDIESITFTEYPDSANYSNVSLNQNLKQVINTDQAKERYDVDISLRFFVSGIPTYNMEKYILSILESYETLEWSVTTWYTKVIALESRLVSGKQIYALEKIKSLNWYVNSLSQEISRFQVKFQKKDNIQNSYEEAIELSRKIQIINIELDRALKDIE